MVRHMAVFAGAIAAVLLPAAAGAPAPKVGDTYEITLTRESAQHGERGSSGSSHDRDTIIERVTALRADGLELEYDLPKSITADERASNWQLPARVFKPLQGPAQLLNAKELETRVDAWLKAGGLSRADCGHWTFTWNAFRIECDPQSVMRTIDAFDLRTADLRAGAPYRTIGALGAGTLTQKSTGGAVFTVVLPVDPEQLRHAEAEADVITGEILHKPVTLDAALRKRAGETVSGTITVTFEMDAGGSLRRRTKVTQTDIKRPDGDEKSTVTETLERRRVSP